MTIHKSKGLEFPVVIIAGMDKKRNIKSSSEMIRTSEKMGIGIDIIDDILKYKYPSIYKEIIGLEKTKEEKEEELRILYVAMTRAKEKLIMTAKVKSVEKLLQKLNESIINNAESTFTSNHLLFNKLLIFGKTPIGLIEKMLDSLTASALPKYIFDSNIIHLNIAFVNNIKDNEKNFKSKYPSQEINETERDSDGLSKLDKLEIDTMKENESKLILVKVNIAKTIEYLIKEYGAVSKEEIQYYINNINIGEKIQVNMVSLWFAKYFSSTNMLKYVKIDQYATLIAIMMRMMKRKGFIILQYLMCGKVIRLNPKKNVTAKMLNKIQPRIDRIIETKYTRTSQTVEKSGIILDLLNFALFADMELISYDNEKMRGVRIDVNRVSEDLIIEEVLRFINEI